MNDLLASVLQTHGGVDRWTRVHTITARLSIGGPFWGRKGWPEIFGNQTTLELDTRRQHVAVTPFNGLDRRSVFDVNPERIAVYATGGTTVERREDPRASFAGYEVTTPWDALQVGYFISYACWNYLTVPFLFTYPGVQTRELEPWQEDGECWRRLHVTFPRSIATHSTEQVFYYGTDFMQRRMDYAVEVNGGVLVAQYQHEPKTFHGLVFPTRRRVHRRSPDGTADQSQTSITLDITDIEIGSHGQPPSTEPSTSGHGQTGSTRSGTSLNPAREGSRVARRISSGRPARWPGTGAAARQPHRGARC